jgi:hypothetical protein
LATPTVLKIVADGFLLTDQRPFQYGLVVMLAIYLLAGACAGSFMGTNVNTRWDERDDAYLVSLGEAAFTGWRRFAHHWLYWIGLLFGIGGLLLAYFQPQLFS